MAKRKSRKDSSVIDVATFQERDNSTTNTQETLPIATAIELPKSTSVSLRQLKFDDLYGIGCDDIIARAQCKLKKLVDEHVDTRGKSLSLKTIRSYHSALRVFGRFCQIEAKSRDAELLFSDINEILIQHFLNYLYELGVGRTHFSNVKQLLVRCGIGKSFFPKNPYPNSNRKMKGQKKLSKDERALVARAVKKDWSAIRQSSGELTTQQLVSCIVGIALRTGMNPTPLVELRTDCLLPHPLKDDRMVIVSYKRRGNQINVTPAKKHLNGATFKTALPDVIEIVKLIEERNAKVRSNSEYPDRLFVGSARKSNHQHQLGDPIVVTADMLNQRNGLAGFVRRNELYDGFDNLLQLNTMRLRKSFENRIWELSGGDPFMTAAAGNHSVRVSDTHYLEVPEDADERLQFIGETFVNKLLASDAESTPVAHCKDSLDGHRAPKNGNYCDAFLACFRCKSFVVTEDDLHKLFSLYWMLVRERDVMSTRAWSRHFRHILRTIDDNIAPQFDISKVQSMREHAKHNPHPYWQTLDQLGGLESVY
ncbi:phage integrase SAM-like domain-containing protein [Microbulbifer salipaludis]|uniref:Phage integrase SAM-like domain-containing protein n=1 Tax=Microbulbifer salipaludis TaxID=187980 RepID=A0ABS3E8C1_9GAMM|nr:phage integrase SAM-like domain-containing protein [Microbulbifer salipaludis]MBN8431443.1 phage integrase SAM-like domain-containing protein [Microbulbifer salipaludis]